MAERMMMESSRRSGILPVPNSPSIEEERKITEGAMMRRAMRTFQDSEKRFMERKVWDLYLRRDWRRRLWMMAMRREEMARPVIP